MAWQWLQPGDVDAMTADDEDTGAKSPRETTTLFGHAEAEKALLDGYKSG